MSFNAHLTKCEGELRLLTLKDGASKHVDSRQLFFVYLETYPRLSVLS